MAEAKTRADWRKTLHSVIFEADTFWGKSFDIVLMVAIIASVGAVMAESVEDVRMNHGQALRVMEWTFTILFSVEYALRIATIEKPLRYLLSFFGLVDLLSIIPTYLSLLIPGAQSFLVIRALRLLRIFRILKLGRFLSEANLLLTALRQSTRKIIVFMGTVITLVIIIGAAMYIIEGAESGFTSIPRSVYWAIVTLTTVGYGDIAPQSIVGQFLASAVMIAGYGIIAVPTGIVSVELARASHEDGHENTNRACRSCSGEGHDHDAEFCKFCGAAL